ncbi:phosphodiester glycosidase family protein [Proteiniphilum sp.]|uniref:phosphodiester glycosidase family protein n=1 Tax=Proteiniphilum sp. TaxID=1926877 RepID=UPI002B1F93DE|nr:phosphodiester glycosidase family protein [Proteiniphilum sp.]MEA4917093.1 phosphodiester glycosidase family protein [Proteiniphilum sp.]
MNRYVPIAILLLSFSLGWNCKDNIEEAMPVLTGIKVTPDILNLSIGEVQQLKAEPIPSDVPEVSFTWSSDNKNVATVSTSGTVTGIAAGTVHITVKSGSVEKRIPVSVSPAAFKVSIGNTVYVIDTLDYAEIAPGVTWFKFSIPEFVNGFGTLGKGLVVNSLEVDVSSPTSNRLEVCPASPATWGNVERPTAMYARKRAILEAEGYKPVAVINGDFYLLSANNTTGYAYINNRPLGMEIANGMVVQTPYTASYTSGFIIKDNGTLDHHDQLSFSGQVDAGGQSFPLAEVNGFAKRGELVLFNNLANSYPTDSAFAWSPYTSTMVSLSYPEGEWRVNDRMEFIVKEIEYNVETTIPAASPYKGKDFNGQGAILVGNESAGNDSKTFLDNLKVGDRVGVQMDIKSGTIKISDKRIHTVGYGDVILRHGSPVETWKEAHPRTAIGYSLLKDKAYLVVIDGRQSNYSVGATTGQVGAILKALGAYSAVNLDGGGSSAMVVNGEVKNKPSDTNERAVANGIMVTTRINN